MEIFHTWSNDCHCRMNIYTACTNVTDNMRWLAGVYLYSNLVSGHYQPPDSQTAHKGGEKGREANKLNLLKLAMDTADNSNSFSVVVVHFSTPSHVILSIISPKFD